MSCVLQPCKCRLALSGLVSSILKPVRQWAHDFRSTDSRLVRDRRSELLLLLEVFGDISFCCPLFLLHIKIQQLSREIGAPGVIAGQHFSSLSSAKLHPPAQHIPACATRRLCGDVGRGKVSVAFQTASGRYECHTAGLCMPSSHILAWRAHACLPVLMHDGRQGCPSTCWPVASFGSSLPFHKASRSMSISFGTCTTVIQT